MRNENALIHRAVRVGSINGIDQKYGIPEQKKFPMPDADHVRSAIRFFNYVDPAHEKELARAILNRMKEYGMSFDDFTVGEENRFSNYIPETALEHHGILGMKWGVRRFQNEDGTLTPAGKRRMERKDNRWIKRNADKIHNKAYKKSQREMRKVTKQLDRKYSIRLDSERNGRRYMNEYNQNLARIMNTKVENLTSPSGRAVRFVAKRGEYGVHTALADQGYDMNKVKSGIWDDGRVAYKSEKVEKR